MELFLRCKNNFVLVLILSLILCDLIHVSETQVPQSKMKILVRVKLRGHFHFSDSMILLRTRLNDSNLLSRAFFLFNKTVHALKAPSF